MDGLGFPRECINPGAYGQRSDSRGEKMMINARDFYGRSWVAIDDDKGNLNPLSINGI